MLSKKIFLSAAFVSMAGLVACGDDSSSNSGSGELPKSVPTFFDLADVECNADRKCETIIVEDGPDTYECDGVSQWNMLINSMPSKVCPAKEEKGTEGDEEGKTEGDDNKAPESSASETTSTDSGADSADSNTESTDSGEGSEGGEEGGEGGEGSEEGGEEVTGPTGDLVSCSFIADGVKGGTYCEEVAASMQAAIAMECDMMSGTMKTDGGCSQDGVKKKCTSENMNYYVYDGDETCPTFN